MKNAKKLSVTTAQAMTAGYQEALVSLLLQMGDDELVFGHRSSEWLGLAPDLEEDIAFSSIAQDEIGHAALFYKMASSLSGTTADSCAFSRNSSERQNAVFLESSNGDWAHTIVRSYLYNAFEQVRLQACLNSTYVPLQQAAAKILREERYHLLHMETWFTDLALAKGEARRRLERALVEIWAIIGDLFATGHHAQSLVDHGILPVSTEAIFKKWEIVVKPVFANANIDWPKDPNPPSCNGRLGQHKAELRELLLTMTEVSRLDAQATW